MTDFTRKRSIDLGGHKTSVSLEDAFWDEMKRAAKEENIPLRDLVMAIDETRTTSLSSAIRLYVLKRLQDKIS